MSTHCHSCGGPLADPNLKGSSDRFCRYCVDAKGALLPKDRVQHEIAQWLKDWQPGITEKQALDRAAHYMKAMPAWAKE